jgi:NodT family efflux transporter outer membrane factor (OMF) lipoprotein
MTRTIVATVMLFFCLLLTGCAVGPRHQRPQMIPPPNFRDLESAAGSSLAETAWWQVFQDETLQQLIKDAIKNNYDLRIAAIRVEEVRATARIQAAPLYPEISVVGSAGQQKIGIPGLGFPTLRFGSLGPLLSYELDIWGRLRKQRDAGHYEFLASEEGRRFVLIELIAQVAEGYFTLRELDLQLEISKDTVKTRNNTLDLFNKQKQAGVNSGLDITQAEADRAAAAAMVPDLERQIVQQEDSLRFLLAEPPGPIVRGQVLTSQYLPPEIPAGLPVTLLERRPDIRQAEANLKAANALVGVAEANFFPQISLTSVFGGASQQLADAAINTSSFYSVGAGLLAPIFQGGRIKAGHQLAMQQWQESKITYEKSVQSSFREVADALIGYQKYRELRDFQEQRVIALERSLHLSTLRYAGGLSSYLEVLDAQRGLFSAQIALAQTRGNQLLMLAELYRALGGGWQPSFAKIESTHR